MVAHSALVGVPEKCSPIQEDKLHQSKDDCGDNFWEENSKYMLRSQEKDMIVPDNNDHTVRNTKEKARKLTLLQLLSGIWRNQPCRDAFPPWLSQRNCFAPRKAT